MALLSAIAGALGSGLDFFSSQQARKDNMKLAKEGIRIRVNDAKAAGIHPIYALGAPTFSPMSQAGSDFGSSFANIGANLDDVYNKRKTASSDAVVQRLSLERAALENDLLRSQIRATNRAGLPPALGNSDIGGPASIKIPGVEYDVRLRDPKFAQRVQDAWGDIPENILGAMQAAGDFGRTFGSDLERWFKRRFSDYSSTAPRVAPFYPYGKWN